MSRFGEIMTALSPFIYGIYLTVAVIFIGGRILGVWE
jgi:hypothetical protein